MFSKNNSFSSWVLSLGGGELFQIWKESLWRAEQFPFTGSVARLMVGFQSRRLRNFIDFKRIHVLVKNKSHTRGGACKKLVYDVVALGN